MRLLSEVLEEKIKTLPKSPGVYIMRDEEGTVIYVGKAKVLKNRVSQYFGANAVKNSKTNAMVNKIADFEYIITDSEKEALILECNLIKEYQPHYNILLRDDKHYPYVRIDLKKDYPRVEIVRKVRRDGAKYFGPYLEAFSVREVLDGVHKLFPLRSCKKEMTAGGRKERPCLNYQMGRCFAPCAGKISPEEYRKIVDDVIDFLSGKYRPVQKQLKEEMLAASEALDYEKAAACRDKLKILERITERQKAGFPDLHDKDIIALGVGEKSAAVQCFFVRRGKLSGAQRFYIDEPGEAGEVIGGFLKQFYLERNTVAPKVYLSALPEDSALLCEWLADIAGRKVELIVPQRGDNKKLLDMARRNAEEAIRRKEQAEQRAYDRSIGAATELGEALHIGFVRRLECYDISNTQGTDSVGSMVVFIDGKPDKKEYRRFRIKTVKGANDFASMAEVLTRRLLEGFRSEDKEHGFGAVPDLIIVDGGKGQLSAAVEVVESLGLEDTIRLAGLAKREEELFLPGDPEPIVFSKSSPVLGLITAIRDEAHRFAITYHRTLRQNRTLSSELDRIKGVGPRRKKALIEAFGDLEGVKKATVDELAATPGVDIATAREIVKYFST